MPVIKRVTLFFFFLCCYSQLAFGQSCSLLVNSPTVNFGNFNPLQLSPVIGVNQTMTVRCVGGTDPITFALTLSAGGNNSYVPYRQMLRNGAGPEVLNYNFYINSSRTTIWGDGTNSTSFVNQTTGINCRSNTPPCSYIAYGLIPAPQPRVSGGSYSANIIATLTYNP